MVWGGRRFTPMRKAAVSPLITPTTEQRISAHCDAGNHIPTIWELIYVTI
jgi:hypothetical protein